jgi:transposase-like protein
VALATEPTERIKRWTAKWHVALVVSILKGETSVAKAAQTYGLTVAEVEDWLKKFQLEAENALRSRPRDQAAETEDRESRPRQRHLTGGVETIPFRRLGRNTSDA